jgi:hypothetical protein
VSEQTGRGRWVWLVLSGMAFGAIQTAGELGIVLGLMFPAALIAWRRHPLWSYWPVAAGFAGMTGLIAGYYWVETGSAFFKLELSRAVYAQVMTVAPHQPLFYIRVMLKPFAGGGGVFYIAGIGAIAALREKRREALFVTLWAAVTWLLLEFGSVSLTQYQQLSKEVRYLSVIPVALLAGYGIASIRRFVGRSRSGAGRGAPVAAAALAVLVVAGLSMWTLQKSKDLLSDQRESLHELRNQVRRYHGKPIYVTHWMWNTEVGFFMEFDDDYLPSGYDPYHAVNLESADPTSMNRYVQTLEPGESMGPGLLVHDERLFELSRGEGTSWSVGHGEIPDVMAHIPPEWRLIDRIPVSHRYVLALYEIPEGSTWPMPGSP